MTRREQASLAAVVCAAAAVLALEGAALPGAWLPLEEAPVLLDARGAGGDGSGGILFPALVAPAARSLPAASAYAVAKGLSAALWALCAVPAFLLARRLVPGGAALAVAALAVAVPASVYATAAVPDAFALLLATSSLPLLAYAAERGSGRALTCALALAAAAALARPWFVVLPAALLVAYELPRQSERSFLRWPRSLAFAGVAGGAYLLLAELAPEVGQGLADGGAAARAALASVAVGVVGLGVVPWLLAAPAARSVRARPEAALAVACVPALALAAGAFGAAAGGGVEERPLLVVVPLILALAASTLLRAGLDRRAAAVAGLLAAGVVLALPALERAPSARAAGLSLVAPDGGSRAFVVTAALVAVAAAAVLLVVLHRRRVVLAGVVALLLLVGQIAAWGAARGEARALAAAAPEPRDWVDREVGGGARVFVVAPPEAVDRALLAQLMLWNESVRGSRVLDVAQGNPVTGELPIADTPTVLLRAADVELIGGVVAKADVGVLIEPPLPLRLAETVEGVFPDGWSGEQAVYRRFWSANPAPGTVTVTAARTGRRGRGAAEVAVAVGALEADADADQRALARIPADGVVEVEVAVPPPPFRVVVSVRPPFPSAEIGTDDGRLLGAKLRFSYRPRQ